jgi:hypothetical protein
MDPKTPDIWELVFQQTPTIIRWMLGILTMGIFTLAGVLYRWHRDDMRDLHDRVDRLDSHLVAQHTETTRILVQIASNTSRSH